MKEIGSMIIKIMHILYWN